MPSEYLNLEQAAGTNLSVLVPGRFFDCTTHVGSAPSPSLEGFQFVQSSGPVGPEETGQASIGQNLAAGLASGAVVCFLVGIADAQYLVAASWAWLTVAAMSRHIFAEGSHFLWKSLLSLSHKAVDPEFKSLPCCDEQPLPFLEGELISQEQWARAEPCAGFRPNMRYRCR